MNDMPPLVNCTHAVRDPLSRLGRFRLRHAEIRRDDAIRQAQRQYQDEVRAVLNTDRRATIEQSQGLRANGRRWRWGSLITSVGTALTRPFAHALETPPPARHVADIEELARGLGR